MDVVLIKVVLGIWRRVWPPLAGIAIGLLVAHAMRDRRAAPGKIDLTYRPRPNAVQTSVLVPELAPSNGPVHPPTRMLRETP